MEKDFELAFLGILVLTFPWTSNHTIFISANIPTNRFFLIFHNTTGCWFLISVFCGNFLFNEFTTIFLLLDISDFFEIFLLFMNPFIGFKGV